MVAIEPALERHIALIGLMGTGKTTIGDSVATMLDRPRLDNDEVARQLGIDVAALAATDGEDAVRSAEAEVLRHQLAVATPAVVSCAAGVVLDDDLRRRIGASCFVAWLTADLDTMVRRIQGSSQRRPWTEGNLRSTLARQRSGREHLYSSIADMRISTGAIGPQAAAADVVTTFVRTSRRRDRSADQLPAASGDGPPPAT